jgi:hypothetical protein
MSQEPTWKIFRMFSRAVERDLNFGLLRIRYVLKQFRVVGGRLETSSGKNVHKCFIWLKGDENLKYSLQIIVICLYSILKASLKEYLLFHTALSSMQVVAHSS